MADTSGCCGGAKGRHLNGCDGNPSKGRKAKAVEKRRKDKEQYDANKARQKEQAKMRNVGKIRDTAFMDAEIPQGHRQIKNAQGFYIIIKK